MSKQKSELNTIHYKNIFFQNIEFDRLNFIKNKDKKSNIFLFAFFVCSLLILTSTFFIKQVVLFIILILFLLTFLIFFYYFFYKDNLKKREKYLNSFFKNLNSFVFNDNIITDFKLNKQSLEEDQKIFLNAKIFKDIFYFESQNSISFKINNLDIKLFDCIAQKKTLIKLEYLFIGKFLVIPNNYQVDNEIIIYFFNEKEKNNFFYRNDLNFIKNDKNISIFSKNKNISNYLINKIIGCLNVDLFLKKIIVSIQKDKIYFCLNYVDDCLLNPPLEEKFKDGPVIKFKSDLQNIINHLLSE